MPKVFITQENPALNYLPAEQFGEILFMTRGDLSPVRSSLSNDALVTELRAKVREFNPAEDFIVISGSPVVAGIVFMLVGEKTKHLNVLRWSNRDRVYQHLVIDIRGR
jgi:hypothetical protein